MPPSATLPPRPLAALCAVADALAGARWLLSGSAGRALLGCPVRPRDIDLEVDPHDAVAVAAALGVELRPAQGGGRRSRRGRLARAGVEVDVTCGLAIDAPGGRLAPDFALMWERAHPVVIAGRAIRAAPPEESVCRALVLGDWAGVARIAGQVAGAPEAIRLDAGYVSSRLSSARARAAR